MLLLIFDELSRQFIYVVINQRDFGLQMDVRSPFESRSVHDHSQSFVLNHL